MRDFTPEEKELIVNTPVTSDVFDLQKLKSKKSFSTFLRFAESARKASKYEYDLGLGDKYFRLFIALLPNSYKVVKL